MSDLPVIPLIIRGKIIESDLVEFEGRGGSSAFLSPDVNKYMDQLPMQSFGQFKDIHALSTDEIIDFLVGFGATLDIDTNLHLQQAREVSYVTAPTTRSIVDHEYATLKYFFNRQLLEEMIADERDYFDGWVSKVKPNGGTRSIKAFGARGLHIVAGNSPFISAMTIARSALTRGDAIIKSPSNDPFTAAAVIRTLCEYAPDHPVTKHFTVAYWKGGDVDFEQKFYQPANVEKIMAWGGFASVKHVTKYIQPGLELISLDPKRSISVIGPETFESDERMKEAAPRLAADIGGLNQVGCVNARKVYLMTGTEDEDIEKANKFGRLTYEAMMNLPTCFSTKPKSMDRELKSNVEALRMQDDWFNVIGGEDDEGAIIVSQTSDPVTFAAALNDRVANFIPVDTVLEVARDVDAYTQTVGVYPESFKNEVRDILPLYGAQRIVSLGYAVAAESSSGPQDGIEPLRRMIKWLVDEGCEGIDLEAFPPPWENQAAVSETA